MAGSNSSTGPLGRLQIVEKHLVERKTPAITVDIERMTAETDYKFKGWLGLSKDSMETGLVEQEFQPKPFTERDVDIKVTHCGICGSDIHTLTSGWGVGFTEYPVCVGHEIVGTAIRVGSKVKDIKVGDRVGVGAQSDSCMQPDCEGCTEGEEQFCLKQVQTYNGRFADGSRSFGGYSDYSRVPGHFVFKIPDALSSEAAAPMLCGGVTMFSPLKRYGCGPGKKVGIVGLGGLGHFGILFAKALGASRIVAISRRKSKAEDAIKLGADEYIATEDDADWARTHSTSLDLIISTVDSPNMPIGGYLALLRPKGSFIQVGAPEGGLPNFNMLPLIAKGCHVGGSLIGSTADVKEMLQLAADKGIKPWTDTMPLAECNEALKKFQRGEPRYRIVLANEKNIKA
ncbi:hypothetical protein RUND412_005304 [Rhizina undulata]